MYAIISNAITLIVSLANAWTGHIAYTDKRFKSACISYFFSGLCLATLIMNITIRIGK